MQAKLAFNTGVRDLLRVPAGATAFMHTSIEKGVYGYFPGKAGQREVEGAWVLKREIEINEAPEQGYVVWPAAVEKQLAHTGLREILRSPASSELLCLQRLHVVDKVVNTELPHPLIAGPGVEYLTPDRHVAGSVRGHAVGTADDVLIDFSLRELPSVLRRQLSQIGGRLLQSGRSGPIALSRRTVTNRAVLGEHCFPVIRRGVDGGSFLNLCLGSSTGHDQTQQPYRSDYVT
jgi:hypothetical protein